jgi:hypothetical protein
LRKRDIGKPSLASAPGFRFCTNTSALLSIASSSDLSSALPRSSTTDCLPRLSQNEIGAFAMHDMVVLASEIALGTLNLDDTRAGIGEAARALRRCHGLFDRNDKKAGKRQTPSQYDRGRPSTCSAR